MDVAATDGPSGVGRQLNGAAIRETASRVEEEDMPLYTVEGKPTVRLKRQERVTERPRLNLKQDSSERLRQETKLVILEYLRSLPPEKISARNCKEHHRGTSVVKAKTIHSSERPFFDVIEKKRKGSIIRRNSEEYDAKVREKLNNMARPLRKKLTPEILDEIKKFDRCVLKRGGIKPKRKTLPYLRLSASAKSESLDSPITSVTQTLDDMSHDIMKDYPALLDEQLAELLTPLESEKKLSYEKFSTVARSVFEKQLARFTSSIWTQVALVFYLVKEVLYSGTLTDVQVELIVEYATRFITETSADKIKSEGGWVVLDMDIDVLLEEGLFQQDTNNPIGNNVIKCDSDVVDGHATTNESTAESNMAPGYFDMARETVRTLGTYTAAALAVGIGIAYTYFKQQ